MVLLIIPFCVVLISLIILNHSQTTLNDLFYFVSTDPNSFPYKTKTELRRHVAQSEQFTIQDLKGLPELNPPSLMPAGNVGTPVSVFLALIQSCRLPPRLIRKLGLTFPKTGSHRRYGNVPYQYRNSALVTPTDESVFTAGGVEISGPGGVAPGRTAQRVDTEHPGSPPAVNQESQEDELSGPDDVSLKRVN